MSHIDDPMHIPDRDLALIAQAGSAFCDKLMWAYRLGRTQGLLESAQETNRKLKAEMADLRIAI